MVLGHAWAKPKGHLLPFCSHSTLKHDGKRGTKNYQGGTSSCSSFWTFFARSEGCRHGLKTTHNPKVAGSNPAPATTEIERLGEPQAFECFEALRGSGGSIHPLASYFHGSQCDWLKDCAEDRVRAADLLLEQLVELFLVR